MTIFADPNQLRDLSIKLGVDSEMYEAVLMSAMETQAAMCVRTMINKYPDTHFDFPEPDFGIGGLLAGFRGEGKAPPELQECDPQGELS